MEETKSTKTLLIQILLFVLTLISTTLAGAEWMTGKSVLFGEPVLTTSEILAGLYFSIPFIGILSFHEFGHFFMAKYHKVKATLPYYIPLWLGFLPSPSIGTLGAFIRLKSATHSRKQFFDIGIAGPLAGFVVAVGVLWYGFTNLPEPEYIYQIHPEYQQYGPDYADRVYSESPLNFVVGDNLLFLFFKNYIADPEKVPNNYEMYHFPWLFAGYLALFFTALNLIPIGQLDGGHVIYGLFGFKRSRIISRVLFLIMVLISGVGMVPSGTLDLNFVVNTLFYLFFLFLAFYKFESDLRKRVLLVIWVMIIQIFASQYLPVIGDYGIYMIFAFLLGRFLGIEHPQALIDEPLDLKRKILGWFALFVFIICFTPRPLYLEINEKARIEKPGLEQKDKDPSKIITWRMVEIP